MGWSFPLSQALRAHSERMPSRVAQFAPDREPAGPPIRRRAEKARPGDIAESLWEWAFGWFISALPFGADFSLKTLPHMAGLLIRHLAANGGIRCQTALRRHCLIITNAPISTSTAITAIPTCAATSSQEDVLPDRSPFTCSAVTCALGFP